MPSRSSFQIFSRGHGITTQNKNSWYWEACCFIYWWRNSVRNFISRRYQTFWGARSRQKWSFWNTLILIFMFPAIYFGTNLAWCTDQGVLGRIIPVKHSWLNNNNQNGFPKTIFRVYGIFLNSLDPGGSFEYGGRSVGWRWDNKELKFVLWNYFTARYRYSLTGVWTLRTSQKVTRVAQIDISKRFIFKSTSNYPNVSQILRQCMGNGAASEHSKKWARELSNRTPGKLFFR